MTPSAWTHETLDDEHSTPKKNTACCYSSLQIPKWYVPTVPWKHVWLYSWNTLCKHTQAAALQLKIPNVNLTTSRCNIRYFSPLIWQQVLKEIRISGKLEHFKREIKKCKICVKTWIAASIIADPCTWHLHVWVKTMISPTGAQLVRYAIVVLISLHLHLSLPPSICTYAPITFHLAPIVYVENILIAMLQF